MNKKIYIQISLIFLVIFIIIFIYIYYFSSSKTKITENDKEKTEVNTVQGTDDLIMMHKNLQEKYTEEITEYFTNRGEVIDLRDVRIERIAQYN